jgi:uncharacterized protein YbjT (DUF2867 family)
VANTCAVTGAFGYSGRRITERLLAAGVAVRTLTNSPKRPNPFGDQVQVFPYNFERYGELVQSLEGVSVFYNTYWVRFNHRSFKHEEAVQNTMLLFRAAKEAGVRRVVHVSITNPSEDSPFEYFRGKACLERALRETGLSHAILRPAVFFGGEDILINNIAYLLRHFPVFAVAGSGTYRLQPIHVDDFADLAVAQGGLEGDRIIDAIGPETFTFTELVATLNDILRTNRRVVYLPAPLVTLGGKLLGAFLGDVLITREEVQGLMADLLCTSSPPAGKTALTSWARQNASALGQRYHSELARRRDRESAYGSL